MRWMIRTLLMGAITALAATPLPAPATAAESSVWAGLPSALSVRAGTGRASVRADVGLNVRSGPGTQHRVLRRLPHRAAVAVACRVRGQQIVGTQRTTARWDRLSGGGYVSDAFLAWSTSRSAVRSCYAAAVAPGEAPVATVALPWPLNVRSGPGTGHAIVGEVGSGARVAVACRVWAQPISGDPVWYRIGARRYVTQAFLRWSPSRPWLRWCGQAAPERPAPSTAAFLARVARPAQASARRWGVPASVTIAQAILESGWGRSSLTARDHNYFGMKCFGGPGPIAIGCSTYATHECDAKHCWGIRDSFRVYRNTWDSFSDHGRALARLPIYATAMRYASAPERFATEIHKAGYATSPTYAAKLIGIMRHFNLYRYDRARA